MRLCSLKHTSQDARGICTPNPRKLREDSIRIAFATLKLAATITGPKILGIICLMITRKFDAPRFCVATTKSRSFNDIVSALVILATDARENRLNTTIRVGKPGFQKVFKITINSILGRARENICKTHQKHIYFSSDITGEYTLMMFRLQLS